MKTIKTFLIIFLAGIILSGCKEKKEIEIVPDLESIYLPVNQVTVPPKELNGLDTLYKKDITNIIKAYAITNSKYPVEYKIDLRLYINEDGTIHMIKNLGSKIKYTTSSEQINYDVMNKILVAISRSMKDWKFNPAIKDSKPIKSRTDFNVTMIDSSEGRYYVNVGNLFNIIPNMNDFVPVDKMTEVLIPSVPHYPELAKRAGIEGTAYVKILVSTEGSPVKAVVIKTDNEIFNQPSIDAAMQFKFTSAKRDNKPVAVWVVIPFRYRLDGSKGELMHYKDLKDMPKKK